MRTLIWLILLFVAAVVSARWLGTNDALVSFHQGAWRVDLSLNLFLLLQLALVALLYGGQRSLDALTSLPRRAREWRELKRERAAQAALRRAWVELFAARFARAQRAAQQALALRDDSPSLKDDGEFGALAELVAGLAMHQLQDRQGRDAATARVMAQLDAEGVTGSLRDGALLLAAEWALEDLRPDEGRQWLERLPPGVARRTQALRLRLALARQQRQPAEALQVARLLDKHQGFKADAGAVLLRTLACETLDQAFDEQQLLHAWEALEARERDDAFVAARAAQRAVAVGAPHLAVRWTRPLWERAASLGPEARAQLAVALGECAGQLGPEWLPLLETLLAAHGREPAVQAWVGIVFAERQLWGKARPLLQQAAGQAQLAVRQRRRCLRWLAHLAREAGDDAAATAHEQQAAALD